MVEKINNIVNLTVVSRDENDLKAEYRAGFTQGKLQGRTIISARDNAWDNAYLTNPSHTFPKQHGPSQDELDEAAGVTARRSSGAGHPGNGRRCVMYLTGWMAHLP